MKYVKTTYGKLKVRTIFWVGVSEGDPDCFPGNPNIARRKTKRGCKWADGTPNRWLLCISPLDDFPVWIKAPRKKRRTNKAAARPTDPITSHRAADSMNKDGKLAKQQDDALRAIRLCQGRTAKELESVFYDTHGKIHRRVADLVRKGLVRREYPEGCREARLYPV